MSTIAKAGAAATAATSGDAPAFVAGAPPIQGPAAQSQPPTPGAPPPHGLPPPSFSDTAASPTAAPHSQAQASPLPSRGGGGGGRYGGGGRGGGGGHHGSGDRRHHGQRGGGDGDSTGTGGRNPSGGRNLYNPQGRGGGHHQHQHHHPQPVQVHQASGLPHGHVPAYLPGSASLVEELDARLMVVMRDGRHLIGTLSSYDQFSNLVLDETVERRHVVIPKDPSSSSSSTAVYYSDVPLGLYVVRGDSVVIMGRTSPAATVGQAVSLQELEEIQRKQAAAAELEWDVDTDLVA